MKVPVVKDIKVVKPDLGGISTEVWINTLRGQVEALRKELDKAKKDIANMRKTINSHAAGLGDLSASVSAKITALENKSASAADHVHDYTYSAVHASQVHVTDGNGHPGTASLVAAENVIGQTSKPK